MCVVCVYVHRHRYVSHVNYSKYTRRNANTCNTHIHTNIHTNIHIHNSTQIFDASSKHIYIYIHTYIHAYTHTNLPW